MFGILLAFPVVTALILLFLLSQNSRNIAGFRGESKVAKQLEQLKDDEYSVFNDILIQTSKGSTQIDHVVISLYGIFVIETKNFSGSIHGTEKSEYWTQYIYTHQSRFRNPIKQNWAHIYALKEILLEYTQVMYHSIIVFSGKAELKNKKSKVPVIHFEQLIQTIRNKSETAHLSNEQVKCIVNRLNEKNIQDKKTRREYRSYIKKYAIERQKKEKLLICPKCDGRLVIRRGRYGGFYGCSNYPQCKYTLYSINTVVDSPRAPGHKAR